MKPNSLKRVSNDTLIGGQSGMFAPTWNFHAVKSKFEKMTPEKCQFSDMSMLSLHHRTNDQKLLLTYIARRLFPADLTLKTGCVLYAEKYGINSSSPGDPYSRHCSRQLMKTLRPKEILLKLSNIAFGNNVFNIIWQIYLSGFGIFRF